MEPFKTLKRGDHASNEGTQRERVPVLIFEDAQQMSYQVARRIAREIEERRAVSKSLVLGLPTGSTPVGVYRELARMHEEEGLDLSGVVTFNLDEYYPMDPENLQSYHRFMQENFFEHVNIPEESIHIPRGDLAPEEVEAYCAGYEHAIEKAGGIDLMLLGIGRSGHIGFNEPGSDKDSRTRLVVLDEITVKDAASDFFGEENVPQEAITMGVGTIMGAREVILMATGEHKAPIIRQAVEEEPSRSITASYLQQHRDASFYVDRAAASELTREKTPWVVTGVDWNRQAAKRAVIWLSGIVDKAILRLEKADFHRNHLHGLTQAYPDTDALCREVFEDLRRRIAYRDGLPQERGLPRGERVVVFSPHPDDDVISMGGMLRKLVEQGNDVDVAYMTNGSVAVFDGDVKRHLRFARMSLDLLGIAGEAAENARGAAQDAIDFVRGKAPAAVDTPAVQQLKAFIRYTEAIAAIEVVGLHAKDARFLDMPFYKTGRVRKDPIGAADVRVVLDVLEETRPDHLFVAGDLSDPHGTHRMCYKAIKEALAQYREAPEQQREASEQHEAPREAPEEPRAADEDTSAETPPAETPPAGDGEAAPAAVEGHAPTDGAAPRSPRIWLYRGAWQEWEVHRADVFVPLSKAELSRKIEAIFKHESQKDRAMFPGAYDEREFWQRAKGRNTETAARLNRLGLPEFYAAEAFVTVEEMP